MPVPNTFANATATIPLSQLDANFATTITLGNTAIQLGNTVSTLNNMTLANVTVTSGNVTITNVTVTTANVTTANIATAQIANVTVSGTGTFAAGSNTAPSITTSGDTNTGIFFPAADTIAFTEGGVESMRIDSSGQVGIGTTSPANRLNVIGTGIGFGTANINTEIVQENTTNKRGLILGYDSSGQIGVIGANSGGAASTLAFWNYSGSAWAERMRIDSSGNLGLGVTPSAWRSNARAFQFNNVGSLSQQSNGYINLAYNAYEDGTNTFRYIVTDGAARFGVINGQFAWFNAASGTAGNAITFTQAMTLDAIGVLGLGTSSPQGVGGSVSVHVNDTNNPAIRLTNSSTGATSADGTAIFVGNAAGTGTTSLNLYNYENSPTVFFTNQAERARITSGGFVGIGTPSPNYKLTVQDDSATAGTIDVLDLFNGASSVATVGMVFRTGANNVTAAIRNVTTGTNAAALTFLTNNNAGLTERARFTAAGGFTCAGIYNTTVGATNRDVFVDNGGVVGYVASIREAKTNIQDLTDTSWLHQLNPVTFNYRKKDEEGNYTDETDGDIQYGMIAEDVEQVRPDLCFYDEVDGEQELRGIQYSKLVPVMLKEIQKLRAELNALKGNA